MKIQTTLLALLLVSASMTGQDNPYESTMLRSIESLDKASEKQEFLACASQFERVANAEKNRWLPFYYGAYSLILYSFDEADGGERDLILDRAQELLDRASELVDKSPEPDPGRSELHTLQSFLYNSRIVVDPMNRGMVYIDKIFDELEKARSLHSENPRPYFLEGVNMLNMPPAMGGGPEVARPFLEQADARFKTFTHEDSLWPDWGEETNRAELEKL